MGQSSLTIKSLIIIKFQVVPAFDAAVNELFFERYPAAVLEHQIQVRPFNAPQRHMRDLNPEGIWYISNFLIFSLTVNHVLLQ